MHKCPVVSHSAGLHILFEWFLRLAQEVDLVRRIANAEYTTLALFVFLSTFGDRFTGLNTLDREMTQGKCGVLVSLMDNIRYYVYQCGRWRSLTS